MMRYRIAALIFAAVAVGEATGKWTPDGLAALGCALAAIDYWNRRRA